MEKSKLLHNYSEARNLIGQYPYRMRQSCMGNLKVDVVLHFTRLLRAQNCRHKTILTFEISKERRQSQILTHKVQKL